MIKRLDNHATALETLEESDQVITVRRGDCNSPSFTVYGDCGGVINTGSNRVLRITDYLGLEFAINPWEHEESELLQTLKDIRTGDRGDLARINFYNFPDNLEVYLVRR